MMATYQHNSTVHCNDTVLYDMNLTVVGDRNTISGMNATVYGNFNVVSGMNATVHGDNNIVNGMNAKVHGTNNTVTGINSTATGHDNIAHAPRMEEHGQTITFNGGRVMTVNGGRVGITINGVGINAFVEQALSGAIGSDGRVLRPIQVNLRGDDEETDDDAEVCRVCWANKKCVMSTCCQASTACVQCAKSLYEGKNIGDVQCMMCRRDVEQVFRVF